MIKLNRVRTSNAVTTALRGKRRVSRNVQLLEMARDGEFDFKSDVWKNAKKQLKKESHNKCAYCESPTAVVAHGDVEHFRPKSTYWWLAYCYYNYLYSCQICNQSFKSNHFPVAGAPLAPSPPLPDPLPAAQPALRPLAAALTPDPLNDDEGQPLVQFMADATAEQPGLIDPYMTDPEPFFKWVADDTLREVALAPANDNPATMRAFEATRDFMGLNREELRKERYQTYSRLRAFKEFFAAASAGDSVRDIAAEQIRDMMEPDAEYAGMVGYFVRTEWGLEL